MAKILNLDELATESRVLMLHGKEYPMREMDVAAFIETTRQAELAQKEAEREGKSELEVSELVEKLVDMIHETFPTCPMEELRGLKMNQLNAILEFMRGEYDDQGEESEKK